MTIEPTSFASLKIEMSLFAKCLINGENQDIFKNALAFGSTCKVYYYVIKSYPFFKTILGFINPNYRCFTAKEIENNEISFLISWLKLRNSFRAKCKVFPLICFGAALASEKGVEIFSVTESVKQNYFLKENCQPQSIEIPENWQVPQRDVWKDSPLVARSEEFLAFNGRCDSAIYIFPPDQKKCLAKYEVKGEIYQLAIKDNLLIVYEKNISTSNKLIIFDLKVLSELHPINIIALPLPILWTLSFSICFNQKYLIYIHSTAQNIHQLYALPISRLRSVNLDFSTESIKSPIINGFFCILPQNDHFIAVIFKNASICDVSKIYIQEKEFKRTEITTNLVIFKSKDMLLDICFSNDQIYFAYGNLYQRTTLSSYDILTNTIKQIFFLSSETSCYPFRPRFLTTTKKVYYLAMGGNKCFLTTLSTPK